MINLLLNSMMVENELEDALMTAIAYEMQDPTLILKEAGIESSVPLLQLVQQLMNNSTGRQLALLEQVGFNHSLHSLIPITHSNHSLSGCSLSLYTSFGLQSHPLPLLLWVQEGKGLPGTCCWASCSQHISILVCLFVV